MPAESQDSRKSARSVRRARRAQAISQTQSAAAIRLLEGERVVSLYTDPITKAASLQDRGGVLVLARNDPNALRDAAAVAAHRGWAKVEVRGAPAFRREAWMALRAQGLEVTGYRPTERDRQALDRRQPRSVSSQEIERTPRRASAAERLAVVETIASRLRDPDRRQAVLARTRERLADWLERGGEPAYGRNRSQHEVVGRERRR